ncbi:MAG: exosortase family protein XrtF [Bacteroidetes bacterium]|nr:exosortase family protein XrtF [Bacteroidota bacterium]
MKFLIENKKSLIFLATFVGAYLILNTLYGFFIQAYYPSSDPFTRFVSANAVWVLSWFDPSVADFPSQFSEYIPIANDRENMIYVFEGCNSLNVMIVYGSFLLAFRGSAKAFAVFMGVGMAAIYVLNVARIVLLYAVAFYFPAQLYFFHKYLFTAIIYVAVFVLWFFWVKQVKKTSGEPS